jgi:sodium transport system permease protein
MRPPDATQRPLRVEDGLVLFAVCYLLFHLGGQFLHAAHLPVALLGLGQWLFIAAPVLIFLHLRGLDVRRSLGLAAPATGHLVWSVILALGVIALTIVYMTFQDGMLEQFVWYREQRVLWQDRLTATSGPQMIWLLLTVAVTPAICEEMLFRGVITSALVPHLSAAKTCVLVGVMFGLFHSDPLQILPTALLGMLLTWLALRTGSLVPCILFHLIFNAVTLAMHRWMPETSVSFDLEVRLLWALTLGGAAVTLAALWGLWPRTPRDLDHTPEGRAPTGVQNATGVNPS